VALAVAAGLGAGLVISILTVLAEHSRIAINSYALYGNGALIVPAILGAFALYPGWTWIRSRGGQALEMALFVVGLHFGVGLTSALEVLFYPSAADLTLADALPGFFLTGAIFVLPASLVAALAYWIGMRAHGTSLSIAIVAGVLLAAFLAVFWGIGLGILSGGAVALAQRAPLQRVAIGIALLVAVIVVGNLPLSGALTTPPG
jgi:hypothetical protein